MIVYPLGNLLMVQELCFKVFGKPRLLIFALSFNTQCDPMFAIVGACILVIEKAWSQQGERRLVLYTMPEIMQLLHLLQPLTILKS